MQLKGALTDFSWQSALFHLKTCGKHAQFLSVMLIMFMESKHCWLLGVHVTLCYAGFAGVDVDDNVVIVTDDVGYEVLLA